VERTKHVQQIQQSQRIDVGGIALALAERGRGAPVVILNGFTGCSESMSGTAAALSAGFRALSVDLVGHGQSDKPADPRRYSMAACVEQLAALLDRLEIERAHWIGYSMGGRAALAFAVAHPERVDRMLLVGASAGLADPTARAERIASDEALADRIERDGVEPFVDYWMSLPLFESQRCLGKEVLEAARAQRLRNSAHALANSLRGMGSGAQTPLAQSLPAVAAPVCLVVGADDAKFAAIACDLAARLADGQVASIDGAGHAAHLENPEAFAAVAMQFFEQGTAG